MQSNSNFINEKAVELFVNKTEKIHYKFWFYPEDPEVSAHNKGYVWRCLLF